MRIRWKILLLVTVGALLLNLVLYLTAQQKLLPIMTHLESERVQKLLKQGFSDLFHIVDELQRIAEEYATRDDTYDFVVTRVGSYINLNLTESTFTNLQLSLVLIVDTQGKPVYGGYYDYESGSAKAIPIEVQNALLAEPAFRDFEGEDTFISGFYRIGEQVFVLAAEPVVKSEGGGPIRGTLLLGRLLDAATLADVSADWGHSLSLRLLEHEDAGNATSGADSRYLFAVSVVDGETLSGRILVLDLLGRPLMELSALFRRDFFVHGTNLLETLLRWNLAVCLLFSLVVYLTVDKALRSRELRREVDARYQQLSQEFSTILDGIPNPLTLVSPELKVLWANFAGAENLAGIYSAENGKYVAHVDFLSGFAAGEGAVERCLVSRKAEKHIGELADGRIMEEFAYPLLNDDNEIQSVIHWQSDITEAVFLKREADQNSRLASIGELAAGVAHEINNPTGMILLNLGLLTDVHLDLEPILDEYLEQNPDFELGRIPYPLLRKKIPYLLKEMTEGGQRIKRIVEDLKGFARNDAGEQEKTIAINEVAAAAARLVEYQLSRATDHFRFSAGEDLPLVRGNFRRLEQVVVNLLVNATQALDSREQGISLVTRLSEDGESVVVEVKDQGRGIDPAHVDKVTDPFFTTRRNDGGTGLGLSLSARIAEEYGGSLRILSKVGIGSRISLRLPVERSNDES